MASHCTECGQELTDSEARLWEDCFRCGHRYPVNRHAAIGKRMPHRKYEQHPPMPWQVAAMYAKMQEGD